MTSHAEIRVLPSNVANKIAAGEVVERPASVLKELMENAVDAGASRIDVSIAVGGRKLVAVSDDGPGMNRDNALLAFERHATSKIRDVDDIENIATLGFRGEALAAIASVSRLRLTTCIAGDDSGTEILIAGGKLQDVRDIGCPAGTSIEVRDMFFNVPARRKFLRTHQTELSHIRTTFVIQALANPTISINMKVDDRETYRLAAGAEVKDRMQDLFGPDYQKNLKPVNHRTNEVAVSGHVSLPVVSRADRSEIYVFVNGRATGAPLLSYAIREGYRTLLAKDRHPSVFLFLEMGSGLVDVNVHPAKKEVRFRHPSEVRDAVINAIRKALGSGPVIPVSSGKQILPGERISARPVVEQQLRIENLPVTRTFRYPRMMMDTEKGVEHPASSVQCASEEKKDEAPSPEHRLSAVASAEAEALSTAGRSPWISCRVLGQIGGLYVVMETEDGYVLMDPHAAHERVLFERFMADFLDGKVQVQNLLIPETVEMRAGDAARVRKNLELFKQMGFGISEFGGDAFVVDALPSYFAGASAGSLLAEIAHGLEQAGTRGGKERWREESIAQAACKSAVKARDKLTLEEIEQLVGDLARTEMPYTCPHGRPTMVFTSFKELNKKFARE